MRGTKNITRVVWLVLLVGALAPLAACVATVGVSNASIPKNAAQTCAGHCQSIGMRLSAVAIMADNVGCVCQFASEPKPTAEAAGQMSAPPAGMATIAIAQAAAAAAMNAQRQQQQQRFH